MLIIKNIVKYKPWSALYGRVTQDSQLSLSAHKDLPLPATNPIDQVKTPRMELDMATVEERKHNKSKEYEEIDESHTDRYIVKGHTTTNNFEEVKEVDMTGS